MSLPQPDVILIDPIDFESFPVGGQLSTARSLMKAFGPAVALVGVSSGKWPIGQWTQRSIAGTTYLFFSVCRREPSPKKPLVPARLTCYAALRRFRRQILSLGCRCAFVQAPEALLAVSHWSWNSLCYRFPGVENPLKASRYAFARPMSGLFDRALFSALERVDVILATADQDSINQLIHRSDGRLTYERLTHMPTCVDTSVFYPVHSHSVRAKLHIPAHCPVFVSCGRIGRFKGWNLLLDAFEEFLRIDRNAFLFFVGDGEDRRLLQSEIEQRHLQSQVKITGFQEPDYVSAYLNAADVVVSGSLLEGWSVAILESLACGKAVVSTQVSGASAMIRHGQNGFIVESRDPIKFAEAMRAALNLPHAEIISTSIAREYDLAQFRERLAHLWQPFHYAQREQKQGRVQAVFM